jgi:O-antigen/teichoic acid export membrane protein
MRHVSHIVVRNSAIGIAAQIAIKLLSFGFTVLIVRRLGETAFGQYAYVLAFVAVFAILSDLGLSPYAVRQIARWRDTPDGTTHTNNLFSTVLALRLALATITVLIVVLAVIALGQPVALVGAVALNALGLLLYSVQGTSEAVLAGFERLHLVAGAKVLSQIAFVAVGGLALWLGWGYYGLIAANLIGVALLAIVCWRNVRRLGITAGAIAFRSWPRLIKASLPFGAIGFTLGLSYKFDTILLNQFRGDAETGYYNAAYSLVFATVMLSNVINTALYPSFTRQAARDTAVLGEMYGRALRYLLIASLPVAVGGSLLADQVIPFLYGAAFTPSVVALRIIIWTAPLMFASEFLGYIVLIQNNERAAARAVFVSTACNIGLNLLLVPRFGLLAAATMTVLTEAILVSQYVWRLRATLRQLRWSMVLGRPLAAALLMGLLVLLAQTHVPFLLNVLLGATTYAGLLLLLGVIGGDELRFVRSLRSQATPS